MLWRRTEPKYIANPVLSRALEVLFILHADHEQNCSTNTMRAVGSSQADPFATTAAAIAALSGPLHGGANEEVLSMLDEIGTQGEYPGFHPAGQGRQVQADGLRAPGLQELRPAGAHHQAGRRGGVRGDRAQSEDRHRAGAGADRAFRRVLHQTQAVPERGLLLGHHLPGDGLHSRTRSRCCSRSRGRWAGWRNGRRCCRIPSRRSRGRGRYTSERIGASSCRWRSAAFGSSWKFKASFEDGQRAWRRGGRRRSAFSRSACRWRCFAGWDGRS